MGLEPGTTGLRVHRADHSAMLPPLQNALQKHNFSVETGQTKHSSSWEPKRLSNKIMVKSRNVIITPCVNIIIVVIFV